MPKFLKESMKLNGDFHSPERCELNPPQNFFFRGGGGGGGELRIFSGTQSPIFCKLFSIVC